jgi:hypothetical protein
MVALRDSDVHADVPATAHECGEIRALSASGSRWDRVAAIHLGDGKRANDMA